MLFSCHLQQWLQGQRSPQHPRTGIESSDTLESAQTQNTGTYEIIILRVNNKLVSAVCMSVHTHSCFVPAAWRGQVCPWQAMCLWEWQDYTYSNKTSDGNTLSKKKKQKKQQKKTGDLFQLTR